MLESIALRAGNKTGLYTSPHLVRLAERVRIGGAPIEDRALDEALHRVLTDAPDDLTFFETLTLAAFVAFRDASVDVAVLEVGLGGRLDATNIVEAPLATGITSITEGEAGKDLEHGALLGATTVDIAREKAGIAKAGVGLVVGPIASDARAAILEVARERGATPVWVCSGATDRGAEVRVDVGARPARVSLPQDVSLTLAPSLPGDHQIHNAAIAAAMARLAAPKLRFESTEIERGIANTSWPGRLERIDVDGRIVLLDCAHNVEGARALAAALVNTSASTDARVLLFGALADKAFASMLRVIGHLCRERVYTCPAGRSPASLDALRAIAKGHAEPDPLRALERAMDLAGAGDTVVVCGSIYLVGAIRAHLLGIDPDPVIAL